MGATDASRAGALIFVGAVQFAIFMVMAQAYYPGYSISSNYISDLGSTCNSVCATYEPASAIFTASVIALGLLLLAGAFYLNRGLRSWMGAATVALTGVGAIGVGVFSESFGSVHALFSLVAFLFSGLSAVALARAQRKPMTYFSAILGVATLAALSLYVPNIYLGLGPGGMESMVVYPALLWGIAFGAYLMGMQADSRSATPES